MIYDSLSPSTICCFCLFDCTIFFFTVYRVISLELLILLNNFIFGGKFYFLHCLRFRGSEFIIHSRGYPKKPHKNYSSRTVVHGLNIWLYWHADIKVRRFRHNMAITPQISISKKCFAAIFWYYHKCCEIFENARFVIFCGKINISSSKIS